MMTLDEVIDLMYNLYSKHHDKSRQHPIGLYIETKMFGFYKDNYGIDCVQLLYDRLVARNLSTVALSVANNLPIIIESFEADANKAMLNLTDLPIIRLMNEWDGNQAAGLLADISTYAHGIGPRQELWRYPHFRDMAKTYKLQVHPWTLLDDALKWTSNPVDELNYFVTTGVNGIFVEFPHTAVTTYNWNVLHPKYGNQAEAEDETLGFPWKFLSF